MFDRTASLTLLLLQNRYHQQSLQGRQGWNITGCAVMPFIDSRLSLISVNSRPIIMDLTANTKGMNVITRYIRM